MGMHIFFKLPASLQLIFMVISIFPSIQSHSGQFMVLPHMVTALPYKRSVCPLHPIWIMYSKPEGTQQSKYDQQTCPHP